MVLQWMLSNATVVYMFIPRVMPNCVQFCLNVSSGSTEARHYRLKWKMAHLSCTYCPHFYTLQWLFANKKNTTKKLVINFKSDVLFDEMVNDCGILLYALGITFTDMLKMGWIIWLGIHCERYKHVQSFIWSGANRKTCNFFCYSSQLFSAHKKKMGWCRNEVWGKLSNQLTLN